MEYRQQHDARWMDDLQCAAEYCAIESPSQRNADDNIRLALRAVIQTSCQTPWTS